MANRRLPPIIEIVVAGWRDGLRALGAMPIIGLVAYLAMISLALLEGILGLLVPEPSKLSLGVLLLISVVSDIVYAFLIAPLAIAVHRYVLLGEVTTGYSLGPSNLRYLRFAICSAFILLAYQAPRFVVLIMATDLLDKDYGIFVLLAVVILLLLVVFRLLILFPAIAVDAPGAQWRNADKDTEGHTLYVAIVAICTTLPATLIRMFLKNLAGQGSGSSNIGLMIFDSITAVPLVCIYVAAASHLFLVLAYNLRRPPGSAPPTG